MDLRCDEDCHIRWGNDSYGIYVLQLLLVAVAKII